MLLADCQREEVGVGGGVSVHTRWRSERKVGTHRCVPSLNRAWQLGEEKVREERRGFALFTHTRSLWVRH